MNTRLLGLQLGLIKSAQQNVQFRLPTPEDYKKTGLFNDMSPEEISTRFNKANEIYKSLPLAQQKLYQINPTDLKRDPNRAASVLNRFFKLTRDYSKIRPPAPVAPTPRPSATPVPAAPVAPAKITGLPSPTGNQMLPPMQVPATPQPMGPRPGVINVTPPPGAGPEVNLPKIQPMRQPYSSSAITEPINVGYINEAQISSAERNRLLQEAEAKRKYYEVSGNTEALNQRYPFRGRWDPTLSGLINQQLREKLEEEQAARAAQNQNPAVQ